MSAVAALAACGKHDAHAVHFPKTAKAKKTYPSSTGGGPAPVTLVTAADVIAKEKCEHENHCDRIGAGRRFANSEVCQKSLVHEARSTMTTKQCDTGYIDPESLLECLEAIRTNGCSVDAQVACEASTMCSP
jgi:hypothetical protein